jgi:hypothetical protein
MKIEKIGSLFIDKKLNLYIRIDKDDLEGKGIYYRIKDLEKITDTIQEIEFGGN